MSRICCSEQDITFANILDAAIDCVVCQINGRYQDLGVGRPTMMLLDEAISVLMGITS